MNKQQGRNAYKPLCLIIMCFLMLNLIGISLISAANFDNTYNFDKDIGNYGKYQIKDWFGLQKLMDIQLIENTEVCPEDNCRAEIPINHYQDGILVEDIRFIDVKTGKETKVKNYQLKIDGNNYNIGDETKKGDYNLEVLAELRSFQTVDWQIKVHGKWLDSWAIFGSSLQNGLITYYTFDESGTDTIAKDSVGLLNATGVGIGSGNWVAGALGNAVKLNGVDERFTLDATNFTMGTGNFTLSVWTNTTDITGLNSILGTDVSLSGYMFSFNQNFQPERISLFEGVGGGFEFRADPTPIDIWDGEFHHIVFIRDGQGSNSKIYVDGVSKSISQNVQNNLNGVIIAQIGATLNLGTPANFFNGTLDEMGWWNRSLTATEVGNLNNGGTPLPFLGLSVILNSPENNHISPTSEVEFNCSAIAVSGSTIINISLWTNETGTWILNDTQDFTGIGGLKNTSVFTKSYPDADILDWTCRAFDSDDFGAWADVNRTINIDTSSPQIIINRPSLIENFAKSGDSQELNWSIIEDNLDTVWFEYNNINTTLFGAVNLTSFILGESPFNLTLYANDSGGNINSTFREWNYKIFQTNVSFNNVTFSGAEEIFTLDFILEDGFSISDAVMDYNGTNYTSNILSIGDQIRLSNTINVPLVNNNTNFTFKFIITTNGEMIETGNFTQLVAGLNITDCGSGGTVILNMSLFDEKLKTNITGDIEINVQLIDQASLVEAGFVNLNFNETHSASICLSLVEALDSLFLDAEIKYSSEGYASELYHIQRADLSIVPINLSLFDLNNNESTEFLVTYQDDNLIFVEGAVLQLQRKYISEDLFEVVEAPLTSDGGTAIVHIDLDTNKYKVTIVKDGVVLDIFDNIVFACDNELSGQCTQKLLGQINPQNDIPIEVLTDFSVAITQENDTITTLFSIPSGIPSSVNVVMTQTDQFNNTNICNETVFSSAGAIECTIIPTIGDSFLELSIKKSGELQSQKGYIVQEDFMLEFAGNNYFILFILMLSVIGMAFTSPEWIIINAVITMVLAGALYLATGVNFVVGLGNLIWLIITAVILILKISHQEDR